MDSIEIFKTIITSGVSVTLATNILNSNLIPIPFQKNKRLTAFGVSVVATLASLYHYGITNLTSNWAENIAILLGIYITSSITYNNISK